MAVALQSAGYVTWLGQLYGKALARRHCSSLDYGGTWGSAPSSPSMTGVRRGLSALLMPEWWMVIVGLLVTGIVGLTWSPLLWAWPIALAMAGASVAVSVAVVLDGLRYQRLPLGVFLRWTILLSGLVPGQPLYRTRGRIAGGLTPFRRRWRQGLYLPARYSPRGVERGVAVDGGSAAGG